MSSGMDKPKVLLVDANQNTTQIVSRLTCSLGAILVQARSTLQAISCVTKNRFAVVILYIRPPCDGAFTLTRIIRYHKDVARTPVIMMAPAHLESAYKLSGYAAGAVDYLQDPINTAILCSKMEVFVQMEVQRLELEKHQQSLALLASQDHLTKLANRRSLLAFLRKAVAGCCAAEEARYAAVILLDIDSFKQVNDTLGHSAGDRLLCSVARRLLCPFDVKSDVKSLVARWGGDEFVIAFDGISHPDRAFLMAKKIRARICLPYSLEGKVIQIGVSVGVSTSLEAGPTETRLLSAADKAMYTAKRTGRGIWSACLSEQKPTNSSGAAGQLNPVQDTDWTKFQQTV